MNVISAPRTLKLGGAVVKLTPSGLKLTNTEFCSKKNQFLPDANQKSVLSVGWYGGGGICVPWVQTDM